MVFRRVSGFHVQGDDMTDEKADEIAALRQELDAYHQVVLDLFTLVKHLGEALEALQVQIEMLRDRSF